MQKLAIQRERESLRSHGGVLQAHQQQAEQETERLKVKYETLEKSYDNLKRTRKKRGKAGAQAMVEAAEAQVGDLGRRLTEVQAELDIARKSAADYNAERTKALSDLQNAKSHMERKMAGLQVLLWSRLKVSRCTFDCDFTFGCMHHTRQHLRN